MARFLIEVAAAGVGLAAGIAYTMVLGEMGVIELPLPWLGGGKGLEWALMAVVLGPVIGVQVIRRRILVALVILGIAAFPLGKHLVDESVRKSRIAADAEQVRQWKEQAVSAVRREVPLAADVEATEYRGGGTKCARVLVWAWVEGKSAWYWYEADTSRIAGSAREDRVRDLMAPYLPSGGSLEPLEVLRPDTLRFTYNHSNGNLSGVVRLAQRCTFTLDNLNFDNPPPGAQRQNYPESPLSP